MPMLAVSRHLAKGRKIENVYLATLVLTQKGLWMIDAKICRVLRTGLQGVKLG